MAWTANGLTPCKGGDCHGIDHAWCAPGKHRGPYDRANDFLDTYLTNDRSVS